MFKYKRLKGSGRHPASPIPFVPLCKAPGLGNLHFQPWKTSENVITKHDVTLANNKNYPDNT
jgi:hypothetical protein